MQPHINDLLEATNTYCIMVRRVFSGLENDEMKLGYELAVAYLKKELAAMGLPNHFSWEDRSKS